MISPEVLRRHPHFAGVSDACLKSLSMFSDERSFKAGDLIFEESPALRSTGQIYDKVMLASHLMVLTEGEVDIGFELPNGEQAVVGTLVAGDLMSISALIPPHQLTASGIARQECRLIVIEAEQLRELCEDEHELGYRLMLAVAKSAMSRLRDARIQLAAQS